MLLSITNIVDGTELVFMIDYQDDFAGIAEALVSMGATKTDVNIEKFAKELAEVVQSISSLQPQVVIGKFNNVSLTPHSYD